MTEAKIIHEDLKERLVGLEKLLVDPMSQCYVERLLDVVIAAVHDSNAMSRSKENERLLSFWKRFIDAATCLQSLRRHRQDYSFLAPLGRGAFGRVELVREQSTGRVCAMKVLKKARMLTQLTDYWAEREIMARGESPWIVQLYHAFQDATSLYMVMEYIPGGNLVTWMENLDVISEATCRFYAAETALALRDLHCMGFIHRDLKPDNLLLDVGGHLKLADFGTAIRVDQRTLLIRCDQAVGTPDYLSPEVLLSQGAGGGCYGFEVDWWALGVVVFEMLYGETPFYSQAVVNTYAKIMSHTDNLQYPDDVPVSRAGLDFMKKLLCDRKSRFGIGCSGATEIFSHPWFSAEWAEEQKSTGSLLPTDLSVIDWSWTSIRACRAPFQPRLTGETDSTYYQPDTDDELDDQSTVGVDGADGDVHGGGGRGKQPVEDEEAAAVIARQSSLSEAESERLLSKYPGVQLGFAGFSFASTHPDHVALFNNLRLDTTDSMAPAHSKVDRDSGLPATPGAMNGSTHSDLDVARDTTPRPSGGAAVVSNPPVATTTTPVGSTNGIEARQLTQLARVQSQLEDALGLAEIHSNEVMELTEQLDHAVAVRRELERKLLHHESRLRSASEEAQRRVEVVRAETAANLARAEAEIERWKSFAQSEQAARQSAEAAGSIAVTTATTRLAKRAAELVDRVTCPGRSSGLGSLPLSRVVSPSSLVLTSPDSTASELNALHPPTSPSLLGDPITLDASAPSNNNAGSGLDGQSVATNLLLTRIEELARRAHRAETSNREANETLRSEQHFCGLYKDSLAEKTERIQELTRETDELREMLNACQKDCRRYREEYEAAHRALSEEQQRSARYLNNAQIVEVNERMASQRATAARREVTELRDQLEQSERKLSDSKNNCAAVVNKFKQVMSGENSDAFELMCSASAAQAWKIPLNNTLAVLRCNRNQQLNKRLRNEVHKLNNESQTMQATIAELVRCRDDLRLQLQACRSGNGPYSPADSSLNLSHQSFLHKPSRAGRAVLFGRSKAIPQSVDSGIMVSPSLSRNTEDLTIPLVRSNSLGESSIHSTRTDWDVCPPVSLPMPGRLKLGTSQITAAADYTLSGVLELGVQPARSKKFEWIPRVVQVTRIHLLVWNYNPSTVALIDNNDRYAVSKASAEIAEAEESPMEQPSVECGEPIARIPLSALHSVRQVDPSETSASDPTVVFRLAYDRSAPDVYAMSPVVMDTPLARGQSMSMTLPRKLSTATPFSTTRANHPNPHSNSLFRSMKSRGSSGQLDRIPSITSPPPSSLSPLPGHGGGDAIPHRGHYLQPYRFARLDSCDLCRKPLFNLTNPPPGFSCIYCQTKFHASHWETNDLILPNCPKLVVSYMFRCASKAENVKWISHLNVAMQVCRSATRSKPPPHLSAIQSPLSKSGSSTSECDRYPPRGSENGFSESHVTHATFGNYPQQSPDTITVINSGSFEQSTSLLNATATSSDIEADHSNTSPIIAHSPSSSVTSHAND